MPISDDVTRVYLHRWFPCSTIVLELFISFSFFPLNLCKYFIPHVSHLKVHVHVHIRKVFPSSGMQSYTSSHSSHARLTTRNSP
jgi:hypothetical protein